MFALEGLASLQCEPTAGADDASVREWVAEAVRRIEADLKRSADTHLIAPTLEEEDGFLLWESNSIVRYLAAKRDRAAAARLSGHRPVLQG